MQTPSPQNSTQPAELQQARLELAKLLSKQYSSAKALQKNLTEARVALGENSTEQINSALSDNVTLLMQLEEQSGKVKNWLRENGFAENAVSDAIDSMPQSQDLQKLWGEFKTLILDCQASNNANGALARGQLKHTEQTLYLLTGAPADAQSSYAQDGTCSGANVSRNIAQA